MSKVLDDLTEREKEALRLFGRGHDAKSAARVLKVSVNSINERLREARRKLEVSTSREAARVLLETEAGSAQEAWDKKIDVDEGSATVVDCADPHRRRAKKVSLLALIGVGAMLLIAATALLSFSLTDFQAPETASQPVRAVTAASASPASSSVGALGPDYFIGIEVRSSVQPTATHSITARAGAIASVSRSDAYDIHFVVTPDPDHTGTAVVSASIVIPRAGSTMRYKRTLSVAEGQSAEFELEPIGRSQSPITAVVITPRRVEPGS